MTAGGPFVPDHAPGDPPTTLSPAPRASARHRPWSTVLLVLDGVGIGAGGALLVTAAVLAVQHVVIVSERESGDGIYEPWGLVAAAAAGIAGLVLLAALVPLLVATRRGRVRADAGRPELLSRAALVSACLALLPVLSPVLLGDLLTMVLAGVVCGPYVAVAVVTAVRSRD